MRKTKLLAVILTLATLLSALLVPINAADNTFAFHITDATFTVDGAMGADEGWAEAPAFALDKANATKAPKVYLSTDRENLYIFYDCSNAVIWEAFLMIAIGDVNKTTSANEAADKFVYARIKGKSSRADTLDAYNSQLNYLSDAYSHTAFSKSEWKVNADSTAAEFKIPLPTAFKEALATGDQSFTIACLVREAKADNSGYNTEHSDTYGFDWNNAKTPVSIASANGSQTPIEPEEPVVDPSFAFNITDATFTVDGAMGADEGWAEAPAFALDKADATKAPKVYISTDRENLYIFYDSSSAVIYEAFLFVQLGDENKLSNAAGADKFVYARLKGTCSGADTLNCGNFDYLAAANSNTAFAGSQWKINDTDTAAEFMIPLPDAFKAALAADDQTFKLGCLIREANADNTNYSAQHDNSAYAFDWNSATIPVSITKSPAASNIHVEGFQARKETTTDVRFVASLKGEYTEYDAIGFEFTYNGQSANADCKYVYTSLNAGDGKLDPADFDANYFFCFTIKELAASTNYTFGVRCWTQKADGVKMYGESVTFNISVDANGIATLNK